ncbi:MAG: OmpA family protein [Acidobacteria bacterium]|nr:OmpA family protein [Acidobacteriota bacterium]
MNRRLSATPVSRDRWLISYADFMTLLCAFFMTVYAATLAETPAATAAPAAVAEPVVETAPEPPPVDPAVALRDEVERALAPELAAGYLQIVEDPRGLVVEVPEAGAFDVGQADLAPEARAMLSRIATMLSALPNAVRVEGHSDTTPIRTPQYASNWDLSTARATRVVAFLVTTAGLAPARLSAAGYAEFRPRASNATPEGRARNRRVDLVLLNEATARAEEPAGSVTP